MRSSTVLREPLTVCIIGHPRGSGDDCNLRNHDDRFEPAHGNTAGIARANVGDAAMTVIVFGRAGVQGGGSTCSAGDSDYFGGIAARALSVREQDWMLWVV